MINNLYEKIKIYDTIIIHRHTRPDLDAIGSQLGLKEAIKETFKEKKVYAVGEINEKLNFMGNMDIIDNSIYSNALCIILDVACTNMVSDDRYLKAKDVFVCDHHTNPCDINCEFFIDSSYIACAEIVTEFLIKNNFVINQKSATALFGGIVTDSGRFQYQNTTERTFYLTSKLLGYKADIQFVYENLYVESLQDKKMKAYFSSKFEVTENGLAYLKNDKDVFDLFKVDFFTISRGMVSVMSGISEILIWCNFTFDLEKNSIGCEFRSRNIKIVDIAKKYGGGGHDFACGVTVDTWDKVNLIIQDYDNLLKANR